MSREDPQMKIRLPADLKDQIEAAAKVAGRSMNAEITTRLEQSFGARQWVQEIGLTEKLEEAVRESGRTIEGEIYARLLASLNSWDEVEILKRDLDLEIEENRRLRTELAELRAQSTPATDTVYLLLDSSGYPISWEEVRVLWKAVAQEAKLNVVTLNASIITPDMESSSRRNKEVVELAQKLRRSGKSIVIKGSGKGECSVEEVVAEAGSVRFKKNSKSSKSG